MKKVWYSSSGYCGGHFACLGTMPVGLLSSMPAALTWCHQSSPSRTKVQIAPDLKLQRVQRGLVHAANVPSSVPCYALVVASSPTALFRLVIVGRADAGIGLVVLLGNASGSVWVSIDALGSFGDRGDVNRIRICRVSGRKGIELGFLRLRHGAVAFFHTQAFGRPGARCQVFACGKEHGVFLLADAHHHDVVDGVQEDAGPVFPHDFRIPVYFQHMEVVRHRQADERIAFFGVAGDFAFGFVQVLMKVLCEAQQLQDFGPSLRVCVFPVAGVALGQSSEAFQIEIEYYAHVWLLK